MFEKNLQGSNPKTVDNCFGVAKPPGATSGRSRVNRGDKMHEYGKIVIKLDEFIKKKGISKNKLAQRAEMQRTQLNNYCKNEITRLDTDVLARLCTVLECEISDILEFVPPTRKQ